MVMFLKINPPQLFKGKELVKFPVLPAMILTKILSSYFYVPRQYGSCKGITSHQKNNFDRRKLEIFNKIFIPEVHRILISILHMKIRIYQLPYRSESIFCHHLFHGTTI